MSKTVLPFGKHKGTAVNKLPSSYLRWLSSKLNTDLNYWAELASEELKIRNEDQDLEAMANEFLRQNGVDPDSL